MPLMFGNYGPLQSAEEAYADGYETGLSWEHKHFPGGPWVCRDHRGSDINWSNFCDQTALNNSEWLRGWHNGRKASEKSDV